MNKKMTSALTLALIFVLTASTVFATIRRVNNNPGIAGSVFTTLSAAYDAATAGDTLVLEGSNTSYGDLTLTKKLIIFGTGYHLQQNPQTQASLLTAKLDNITFSTGSAASVIMGCVINSITVNANDVVIARNFITPSSGNAITLNNVTNIIIQQNIVWGMITNIAGKTPSVVIRNNLLSQVNFSSTITSALIINNTIVPDAWTTNYYMTPTPAIDVYNSVIMNNIVKTYQGYYGTSAYILFDANQNNTITYNISSQPDPNNGVGSNNQFGVSMSSIFTNGTGNIDKNYVVIAGSVAENGGQGGIQCGMFGGDYSYVLSGMPPIPHIYKLDADPAGNNTNPLDVKISVKSQN